MKADRPVLDYIHEKRGDADFYFVRNTTAQKIERACLFRQEGKIPRIWHPVNGSIQPVDIYQQSGEQISIPLSFAPYESYFIVFDKKADKQGHYVPGIRDEPRFITNIGG